MSAGSTGWSPSPSAAKRVPPRRLPLRLLPDAAVPTRHYAPKHASHRASALRPHARPCRTRALNWCASTLRCRPCRGWRQPAPATLRTNGCTCAATSCRASLTRSDTEPHGDARVRSTRGQGAALAGAAAKCLRGPAPGHPSQTARFFRVTGAAEAGGDPKSHSVHEDFGPRLPKSL